MKNTKTKSRKKGFTLIELMVVISIIGLLSSIVLVSVKDARQKAQATKFRAEVESFIKALELYRADNGVYLGTLPPSSNFGFSITKQVDGSFTGNVIVPSAPFISYDSYKTPLSTYIKDLPKPIISGSVFQYRGNSNLSPGNWEKCFNDISKRPYIIVISSVNPGFEDWDYLDNSSNSENRNFRCFSLK